MVFSHNEGPAMNVPNYLKDYSSTWAQNQRQANLDWFADARSLQKA